MLANKGVRERKEGVSFRRALPPPSGMGKKKKNMGPTVDELDSLLESAQSSLASLPEADKHGNGLDPDGDADARKMTRELNYRHKVEDLFDEYAPTFEQHLCERLAYDIPSVLLEMLQMEPSFANKAPGVLSEHLALDLGCGTGLAGVALRQHCVGRLEGCDLSQGMLDIARDKAVYDALHRADAVLFLRRQPPAAADIVVAADVLIYVRDLAPLFDAARAVRCT